MPQVEMRNRSCRTYPRTPRDPKAALQAWADRVWKRNCKRVKPQVFTAPAKIIREQGWKTQWVTLDAERNIRHEEQIVCTARPCIVR